MYRGRCSRQPAAHHPPLPAAQAALSLATAVALGATAAAAADKPMYRCQDGDTVTYSQEPCGPGAREIDLHYDTPSSDAAAAADARLQAGEAAADQAAADDSDRRPDPGNPGRGMALSHCRQRCPSTLSKRCGIAGRGTGTGAAGCSTWPNIAHGSVSLPAAGCPNRDRVPTAREPEPAARNPRGGLPVASWSSAASEQLA